MGAEHTEAWVESQLCHNCHFGASDLNALSLIIPPLQNGAMIPRWVV